MAYPSPATATSTSKARCLRVIGLLPPKLCPGSSSLLKSPRSCFEWFASFLPLTSLEPLPPGFFAWFRDALKGQRDLRFPQRSDSVALEHVPGGAFEQR